MSQVFLSYSSYDIERTEAIRDLLEENGISCWIGNRDIPGGADYTEEITAAIKECTVFVLVLTKRAQESQYVISEIEYARSIKKRIIPFMIEDFPIADKLEFHLRNHQRIHAYAGQKAAEVKLVNRVKALVSPENQGLNHWEVPDMQQHRKSQSKGDSEVPKLSGVIDLRYGNTRIPVRGNADGRYQILCRHCEASCVDDNNAKEVAKKTRDLRETCFLWAGVIVTITLIVFFCVAVDAEGNIHIGETSWIVGCVGMALTAAALGVAAISDHVCEKVYATVYPTKYTADQCAKKFLCGKCGNTFVVKIPIDERIRFFYTTEEDGKHKPFE